MMAVYVSRKPKVRTNSVVRRLRAFPAIGEIGVGVGTDVGWDTVLGQYASRQRLRFVRVESSDERITATVLVGEGQQVKRGEVLAYYSFLFGLGFTEYTSPCDGEIVGISQLLGQIAIKEAPVPLNSNIPGTVEAIDDALGVFVKSQGDLVYGALGAGYGRSGVLDVKAEGPGGEVRPQDLSTKETGKIIVVGKNVSQELLEACLRYRVAGVVAGSVSHRVYGWYKDLTERLDWDEFLARYWARELKEKDAKVPAPMEISTSLVVTDGFGDIPMNADAFNLLSAHAGERAFLDGSGAFQSKAAGTDETLPCVFVPREGHAEEDSGRQLEPLVVGDRVRVFGLVSPLLEGTVVEMGEEDITLPTGMATPGVKVQTGDGKTLWVPLFNVEKAD